VAPLSSNATSDPPAKPPHRLILPLGLRVLVEVLRVDERTDAGLYLPVGAKEAQDEALYGKVIEVARDRPTTDDVSENVSGVPHGAHVLFRKEAGVRVPWDDRLRVIDVKDILATVEEVAPGDAH
jgi:co-chaperonin GroES (HSP10)